MLEPRVYAEWLHNEVFLPVVLVIGTDSAKKVVRETNGLSLAELFGPFGGHFRKVSTSCQGPEKVLRLDGLHMRFVDADAASQWSSAHAEQVTTWLVESSAPATPPDPETALLPPSPWYKQWRQAMFSSLRWSEHEGLDQPVTALLVATSKEAKSLSIFDQLLHSSNMPALCTQGVLDPVPGRACVLLHDRSDPESPDPGELQERLDLVQAKFTPHLVNVLQINRGVGEPLPQAPELFRPFVAACCEPPPPPPTQPQQVLGRSLAEEDLEALAQVGQDVLTKAAVPWMQQQLLQLEAQISQSRKGLRNQLKYLWRKPRELSTSGAVAPETGGGGGGGASGPDASGIYPLQNVEGQMRLAGDLAFLLRDYETALGHYRNVLSDFKQDRSFKHSAGAYEMLGLCAYVSGLSRGEWSRCMENAYNDYLQATAGRHAMRVVALHQAMATDYREAASRLVKVSLDIADTGPRSPLIKEQAGQLFCQAGMMRKGAFYIVLAGHSFNKLGFKRLALCSYRAVAEHYATKQWFHISDHCHFSMARQAFGLTLYQESMGHFMRLLNSSVDKRASIQADREATYIKEFLFVAKNWEENCCLDGKPRSLHLQVPCIGPSITVLLPADYTNAQDPASPRLESDKAASLASPPRPPPPPPPPPAPPPPAATEEVLQLSPSCTKVPWERLGEQILTLAQEDRWELQWRSQRSARIFDSHRRIVAVGAEVRVELELSNPMRVKLELTKARLGGSLLSSAPATGKQQGASTAPGSLQLSPAEPAPDFIEAEGDHEDSSAVEFLSKDIVLEPLESKRVQLVAIPRQEGFLCIQRFSWSLGDQVPCSRPLVVKGRRLRATLPQRASAQGVYSSDLRLELRVSQTLPQLKAGLEGWPNDERGLYAGELHECSLVISGSAGQTLRICTSHPSFLAFATPAGLAASCQGSVLTVPSLPSCELRLPLTIRGDQPGRHSLQLCVLVGAQAAEGEGTVSSSSACERRQWITLEEQLTVRPALWCVVRPSPSHREAGRSIFSCTLENRCAEALEIQGVRCVSGSRELSLEECFPSRRHQIEPEKLLQLLFTLPSQEGSAPATQVPTGIREQLLAASRQLAADKRAGSCTAEARPSDAPGQLDFVFKWSLRERSGEAYALGVPRERLPARPRERLDAAPDPLDLQLLAPESAVLAPDLMVPVTLRVRNPSAAGPVSFYVAADTVPEFLWLGCERSAVVTLQPLCSHSATLYAHFTSPGVFNLNRLRAFVVAMPPRTGSVPVSEQTPLAFQCESDRLIHVTKGD